MPERRRWLGVVVFAVAMAWVEAAAVFYLRSLVGRIEPYQPDPLPSGGAWGNAELVREVATLVMIGAVGSLAGRSWRSRFGYSCLAFGIWDIAYYPFLRILTGWPRSLLDWDILFLLPLPWWGPVLAPCLIALLMIGGGTLLGWGDEPERPLWPSRATAWAGGLGVAVALGVFMADAARAWPAGSEAVRRSLPERFGWPVFLFALGLMLLPVGDLIAQVLWGRHRAFERGSVGTAPIP
jgi:hypothetical protein